MAIIVMVTTDQGRMEVELCMRPPEMFAHRRPSSVWLPSPVFVISVMGNLMDVQPIAPVNKV